MKKLVDPPLLTQKLFIVPILYEIVCYLQDCDDPNPLIRALAVRTMGCIRVDKITEYLCEPLRKCLKDEDNPMVSPIWSNPIRCASIC
jgi:hypothetical protein